MYYVCKIVCVANSVDSDQMPRSAAFDLGLHCLPLFAQACLSE